MTVSSRRRSCSLCSVPFASGGLNEPPRVCTTRLATVVVHVHHPGLGGDFLGHLVYVACRRDTGSDVKELTYPRLGSEEADGAAVERPVRPRREGQLWGRS